ncbi:hypothetical protein L204_100876 [Cryptococcus depauperatus]|nr:hypothetical protein L204_01192 [Cryptococcus depauperatus CBS 7855]
MRLASRLPLQLTRTTSRVRSFASQSPPPPSQEPTTYSSKALPRQLHEHPEIPRGMPPLSQKKRATSGPMYRQVEAEAFSGPSKPRLLYERPSAGRRELPKLKSILPFAMALGLLGLGWGLFILHATNSERLASSVLRQVTFQLRNSKEVIAVLGENVRLVDDWWTLGSPWISGTINTMQGRVDLSFRMKGDKAAGTVYFTSIRPQEHGAWRIVRYKIIADDGEVIRLEKTGMRPE